MNWKLGVLLLASFVVYEATTHQISKIKYKTHKRGLNELADYLRKKITNSKRELNLLDDRANKDISFLASETEWLKKTKSTPGKKSGTNGGEAAHFKRCTNLLDESCNNGYVPGTGDDSDWINGDDTPGKRSFNFMDNQNLPESSGGGAAPFKRCTNLLDESCNNGYVPGTGDDSDWINGGDTPGKRSFNFIDNQREAAPFKRCTNLLDESCNNGHVPDTGDDSDWINGDDTPGKRSFNFMDNQNLPGSSGGEAGEAAPFKRCTNLLDESCNNGYVPGTGDDSDWINGGDTPGKRSFNFMKNQNPPGSSGGEVTAFKRCTNLLDESCNNGYVPGTGDDSDWINGDDTPGKRSFNFMDNQNLPGSSGGEVTAFKRCTNLLDESCNNGYVPGTGDDSDWINGDDTPGKRSFNFMDNQNLPGSSGGEAAPFKRCTNLLDESCNNGYVPGTGDDSDWINGDDTPGKRSFHNQNLSGAIGEKVTPFKRCANLLDESCNNGNVPGTGGDSDWINGGGTPGKRGVHSMKYNIPSIRNYFKGVIRGKQSKQHGLKVFGV